MVYLFFIFMYTISIHNLPSEYASENALNTLFSASNKTNMKMISHNTGAMIEFADKESTTKALNLAKEKGMDVKYSTKIKNESQMRCKYYNTPKGCTNPNCPFQHIDDAAKPIEQKVPNIVFPIQQPLQQIAPSFPFQTNTTNNSNSNAFLKNLNQSKLNDKMSKPPIVFHGKNKTFTPSQTPTPFTPSATPFTTATNPFPSTNSNNNNNPFNNIKTTTPFKTTNPFNNTTNNNNSEGGKINTMKINKADVQPFPTFPQMKFNTNSTSTINNNNNNNNRLNIQFPFPAKEENKQQKEEQQPEEVRLMFGRATMKEFTPFPYKEVNVLKKVDDDDNFEISNNELFKNNSKNVNNITKMFNRSKMPELINNNVIMLTRQEKQKQDEKEEEELTSTIKPVQTYNPDIIKTDQNFPIPSPISHYTIINETEKNKYVDGKCTTMCPREEMENRKANFDQDPGIVTAADSDKLHILERPHPNIKDLITGKELKLEDMIIKKFVRSAADNNYTDDLNKIRTPDVLLKTMEYILNNIIDRDKLGFDPRFGTERSISLLEIYNYLWDRTRAIRMDCTSQQYNKGYRNSNDVIRIFEYISRYHIICDHELNYLGEGHSTNNKGGATNVYSSQQNMEQLNACLSQLLDLYDDMRIRHDEMLFSPYEAEFRSYFLLLRLMRTTESGDASSVAELTFSSSKIPKDCLSDPNIKAFFKLYKYIKLNDYNHFFKLIFEVPFLFGCLLRRFYPEMRNKALNTLCQGKGSDYEINEVKKIFGIEDDDEFERFMKYYKLELSENNKIFLGKNTKYSIPSFSFPIYPSPYLLSLTSNIPRRDILYYGSRRVHNYNLPKTLPNYNIPVSEKLMEKLKQKKQITNTTTNNTANSSNNDYKISDESLPPPSSLPPPPLVTARKRRESVDITNNNSSLSLPPPPQLPFDITKTSSSTSTSTTTTTTNNNNNNRIFLHSSNDLKTHKVINPFSSFPIQSENKVNTISTSTTTSNSNILLSPPRSSTEPETSNKILTPTKTDFYIPHQNIESPNRNINNTISLQTSTNIDNSNRSNIISKGEELNNKKQKLIYKTIYNELIENQKVIIGISVMNNFKLKFNFIKWREYVKKVKESRNKKSQNKKYQHKEIKKQIMKNREIKMKNLIEKQKLKIQKEYFNKVVDYVKYNRIVKSLTDTTPEINIKQILSKNQFLNQKIIDISTSKPKQIKQLPQIDIKDLIRKEMIDGNPFLTTYGCKILFTHIADKYKSEKYEQLLYNISEQFNTFYDNLNNSFKLVDDYYKDALRVIFDVIPFTNINEEKMNGNCSIIYLHHFDDINDITSIELVLNQLNNYYVNKSYQFRPSISVLFTVCDEEFNDFNSFQNILNNKFITLSELNVQFLHYHTNDFKHILSIILSNIPKLPTIYKISLQQLVINYLPSILNVNDVFDVCAKKFNILLDQILQISKSIYLPCTEVRCTNHISDLSNELTPLINVLHININDEEITLEVFTKEIQRIMNNLHYSLESIVSINQLLYNSKSSTHNVFYAIIYFILMKLEKDFDIYFKNDCNIVETVLMLFSITYNTVKPQKNKLVVMDEEKEGIKKQKVSDDPILEKFKEANAKYKEEFKLKYKTYLNYDNSD